MVRQGATVIQNIDSNFGQVIRQGASTKRLTRNLTCEQFFKTLPNGEKILRSWMVYFPSKKALYCFCCKLFPKESNSNFNYEDGFNTCWKLNSKISQYESSASHVKNFTNLKELKIWIACGATIDKKEQEVVENQVKNWKEILSRLLDIIRFLTKQNLPSREHREGINYESKDWY